jgi:ribonucleotide monophosphatase NagD (HAD superfamily)
MRFRAGGGTAILITNAPRPGEAVARILDRLKVPREAYDAITSSGDVTRGIVKSRLPESVFHLGPERDLSIFAGLDVRFAPAATADYVVCSGLFDDTIETPESYRDLLAALHAPIYDLALATAAARRGGETPRPQRVLAIGDSVRTDLKGAAALGLECMFITSGIHAEEYGSREAPDLTALNAMFAAAGVMPRGVMRELVW